MTSNKRGTVLLAAAWVAVVPIEVVGQGLDGASRPSAFETAGGAALGGLVIGGGAAGLALLASGGETDCFEGGCAAVVLAGLAYPIGAALGTRWSVGRSGYSLSSGKLAAFSLLGVGAGALAMLGVDQFGGTATLECGPGEEGTEVCTSTGGTGPGDFWYGAAGIGAHLLVMSLLSGQAELADDGRVSVRPLAHRGRLGITVGWSY